MLTVRSRREPPDRATLLLADDTADVCNARLRLAGHLHHYRSPSAERMEVPTSEARSRISELLDAVANGEFVYLTRRGRRVAALMPAGIAENYEKIEDEYWARRADEARARLAAGDDETISFDQLVAEAENAHGKA